MTLQSYLQNLLDTQINLTTTQSEQGSISHNYLRGVLGNKQEVDTSFPWLINGDYLTGSFARKTKIRPLDDIDVMVILDGHGLNPIQGGQYLPATVRGGGQSGSPVTNYTDENNLISSKKIVEIFQSALKDSYPTSSITRNQQAVNVWLDSYGFGIDIVPAFHIIPNNGDCDYYYIPAGNNTHHWMSTNPKIDIEISHRVHKEHNQRFRPVVKLLKHWNQVFNSGRLESFHLEAVAWKIFDDRDYSIQNSTEALNYFFSNAPAHLSDLFPDPTGIGSHIDTYLSEEGRQQTIKVMRAAEGITANAMFLESQGKLEEATLELKKLFN